MSTIFSPSACSWKPPNPWGKCLSHSKREKKHNRRRWTSSRGCSQRRSIGPPHRELLVAHIHLFAFAFFKGVSRLAVISKKFSMQFSQGALLSGAPADWFAWPPFYFLSRQNGGVPPARRSSEKFDRSAGIWLGEIHPICAGNETAWQGHNGNYIRQAYSATV